MTSDSIKPLSGVLVVSIEQALAAPLCTSRLCEMGARVIKIERKEGDFARGYDQAANGLASYFVWTNHGKESCVFDFKDGDDAAALEAVIAKADVFVQNLAPGALSRAGFSSDVLRKKYPALITCDISGYGASETTRHLKAYDLLVQCESGLVGVSGPPGEYGRIGVSICDIGAGMNATIGVLGALALRERTGKGSGIAVSLFDAAADWMTIPYLHERYGQGAPLRQGLRHPSIAPYGAFVCGDKTQIVISIQNEREWKTFCNTFLADAACAEDPRFSSNYLRTQNRSSLDEIVQRRFSELSREAALSLLAQAKIAYGQVRTVAELAEHPALRTWPMQIGDQELQVIASPVQAPWNELRFGPAPALGEHTEAVRSEFLSSVE